MKKCLPDSTKVSKDAKECVQECTSEFISFITSEASERCLMEKRKTINGEDILFAMTTLGFENYSDAIKIYLTKYREVRETRNRRGGGSGANAYGGMQHQRSTGKRVGKKRRGDYGAPIEEEHRVAEGQDEEGGYREDGFTDEEEDEYEHLAH